MTKNVVMTSNGTGLELFETIEEDEREIEIDIERAETFATVGLIATLVLSLVISLVVFFGVVARKRGLKSRFMRWLKEFLNFRKMWVVGILKYVYLFTATFLTIGGIVVMFYGGSEPWVMVLVGLGMITIGNLVLRLGFEMSMIAIGLWENTRDIRGALVKEEVEEKPVHKKPEGVERESNEEKRVERKELAEDE